MIQACRARARASPARAHPSTPLPAQTDRYTPTQPFNVSDTSEQYNNTVDGKPSIELEIFRSRQWWNEVCGYPMKGESARVGSWIGR